MPWIVVLYLLLALIEISTSARLADIYWNASNPIFRIDNTDHIIDVNRGNNPFEYDQVNIICPTYTEGTSKEEDTETYIIYNVSKEEYDSCRITNSNARIIAICDKPHQLKYFTITFRSFTPQPGGLEFKPGQDYYFISTSTGKREGLDRRLGGRCSTHHMKVIFKVCCSQTTLPVDKISDNNDANSNSNNNNNNNNNNIVKDNINSNQSVSPTTVVIPPSELSISSSPSSSHVAYSETSSSSSSSSVPSLPSSHHHQKPSTPSPSVPSSHLIFAMNNGNSIGSGSFVGGLGILSTPTPSPIVVVTPSSLSPFFSSSPSTQSSVLLTSTFSVSPEHWWRPHFTRIQDLKWRSKGPGSVLKDGTLTGSGRDTSSLTNNSNNSTTDTLRPLAWTIFAIACFIFIIFWALWWKVRRNNVMLPMSK